MRRLSRRRLLITAAAVAFAPLPALAQSAWPNKPVRIVVPFAPAGTTDILARALAPELSRAFGQPFIIENKPGAGGNLGADLVAKSGDGHTLLMGTVGTHAINPALYARMPYDHVKDFVPVTLVAGVPNVLVMNPAKAEALGIKSVPDLIRVAKASPGKLNYASGASFAQMVGEAFKRRAGVDLLHVPYKGVQPAVTETVAGRAQVIFADIPSLVPSYRGGKIRLIGVTGSRRSVIVPEVPTIAESGLPGYDYATWYAFVAPAATPKDTLARLNADVVAVLNSPAMKKRFLDLGLEPRPSTPEHVNQLIPAEIARWEPIVRGAGIQPQ